MTKKLELTPAIADDIERLLMNGTPLTTICQNKDAPSLSKVYDWIRKDKEFADKILTARKIAAQTYLDKMIEELEKATNKDIAVTREKLIHYRWMASKLVAIYGDKQQVEVDQKIEITWNNTEDEIKNVTELGS
ncbi:phage terminase small subunit [uncultured Mediterranean phage uvMED]|nr:phage terminase small subunit [uncultured Mediterranean phage uvMED]